jgi:hypothetical protein
MATGSGWWRTVVPLLLWYWNLACPPSLALVSSSSKPHVRWTRLDNCPRICLRSTVHFATIVTLACSVSPFVMDGGTCACMYLGHQVERISGYMVDIASNLTSNEAPLPHCPPVLEGEWENARPPDIPPLIHYPQVNVEARYLIGRSTIPLLQLTRMFRFDSLVSIHCHRPLFGP